MKKSNGVMCGDNGGHVLYCGNIGISLCLDVNTLILSYALWSKVQYFILRSFAAVSFCNGKDNYVSKSCMCF
jgi:hypothetical protein